MNYEEISDYGINKMVSDALGLKTVRYPHAADKRSVGVKNSEVHFEWFDYCNNPSDAWPVMEKNGIATITENGVIIGATNNSQEFYENFGSVVHSCISVKTLRAAMIVFLMMQDDAQCLKP